MAQNQSRIMQGFAAETCRCAVEFQGVVAVPAVGGERLRPRFDRSRR
jgi:hypothetical protein